MRRWLAELLAVEAEKAMRRYAELESGPASSIPLPPAELTESGWVVTVAAGPYMNTRIAPLGTQPPSGPVKCW